MELEVGSFGGVSALPILVAQAVGMFARAGLDVHTSVTTDSAHLHDRLRGGRHDIVHLAPDNVIAWADEAGTPASAWLAGSAGPISLLARDARSISDLRGARIAVDSPATGFAPVLKRLLASGGTDPARVDFVPLGATRLRFAAFQKGAVDATMLTLPWSSLACRAERKRRSNHPGRSHPRRAASADLMCGVVVKLAGHERQGGRSLRRRHRCSRRLAP